MIVFDLECSQSHMFEGWFDSLEAFEEQNAKEMIICPYCNDTDIRKVMSPVSVKKSNPEKQLKSGQIDYQRLAREVVDYVNKNFEDVGSRFTAEALKIHYGVGEKRNIRGSASSDEEETLKEEGIEFFKLPLPKTEDDKDKKN
jgi:hypothetical protein